MKAAPEREMHIEVQHTHIKGMFAITNHNNYIVLLREDFIVTNSWCRLFCRNILSKQLF